MIGDSGSVFVISDGDLYAGLDTQDAVLPPQIDIYDAALLQQLEALPDGVIAASERIAPLQPDHLAYLIYTSGSTGTPKGTGIPHQNVSRLLKQTHEWFGFDHRDVWSLFHSIAFDFSVWEIWGAFGYGGKLVVVSDETRRSTPDFLNLLQVHGVSILNQTPSAFDALLNTAISEADDPSLPSLRLVVFGGEALNPAKLSGWWAQYPVGSPQLVNMYGITETTVHVSYRLLHPDDSQSDVSPVGIPIPDLAAYILDPTLTPVPDGIAGELYIGGCLLYTSPSPRD